MVSPVVLDTETHLIEPGLKAPPLVCLQLRRGNVNTLEHVSRARRWAESFLFSDEPVIGHNIAYDMGVIAAQWPDLIPAIFAKYDRDQITDTLIREQLLMISRGQFKYVPGADGDFVKVRYSLSDCYHRHFGRHLKKEGWRLFYRAFDDYPDTAAWDAVAEHFQQDVAARRYPDWLASYLDRGILKDSDVAALLTAPPWEAREYALADVTSPLEVYQSQESLGPHIYADQFRQGRAAFALHLSSCWGMYTDPEAVDKLEVDLRREFDALQATLEAAGLIREDGTANVAAARDAMIEACAEEGIPVAVTGKGAVSLSAEACDRFDEDSLIGQYSEYLRLRKTLSNDIKMLRSGCDVPIQPSYGLADTGRTTCSGPNIQAINRGAGIREAFRPRPGTVFIQADFEGLELHTFAAWCLEVLGVSEMADKLNAGIDVHTEMAAEVLGISYEEGIKRKKKDHPLAAEMKEYRQRAKAANFGVPGGLGAKKFVRYAKSNYNATLTEPEARHLIDRWKQRFPESFQHFQLAAAATNNMDKAGDEETIFTRRMGGSMRYSAMCNRRFQALGADAAKEALWRVTRACYAEPDSPLYGCRPVAFVHDEIIAECPDDARMPAAAAELGRLMIEGANVYLGKVPVRLTPQAMVLWSKAAEPTYNAAGVLIPWEPAPAAA